MMEWNMKSSQKFCDAIHLLHYPTKVKHCFGFLLGVYFVINVKLFWSLRVCKFVKIGNLTLIYNFLQTSAFDTFVNENWKHSCDLQFHETFCLGHNFLGLCCVEFASVWQQVMEIGNLIMIYNFLQINVFGVSIHENYKHYVDLQFDDRFCMGHDSPMLDIVVVDHIFNKCNY